MKGYCALLLAMTALSASATSVRVTDAYASDSAGNPIQVSLGDRFYVTAHLQMDGELSGPYRLQISIPYLSRTTPYFRIPGDATITWGPYPALLTGPSDVSVSVETSGDEAGVPFRFQVNPAAPSTAIEYFNPKPLSGSVSAIATLSTGSVSGLTWYVPVPTSGGFQQALAVSYRGQKTTSLPFSQPVATDPKVAATAVQFQTLASSVRSNETLLRQVAFGSYARLAPNVSVWLKAETLVESRSSEIGTFVARALPRNYRTTMKPYDAARTLFQAVVARLRYLDTEAKPDALVALRTGQGSCAHFASLFVACCRSIGIPARAVCGTTAGENEWHVWAEFWMPGAGWVPADPSYADGLVPDGSMPLYFGTIPELNERVATTYGFDHFVGSVRMPWLQSPAVWAARGTQVTSVEDSSSVASAFGG